MRKTILRSCLLLIIASSCSTQQESPLSAFGVFCEMVANDAKPMALHFPMEKSEVEQLWPEFLKVAEGYGVQLFQENDFPATMLFPAEDTKGKTVVLIYKGQRLEQYQQWKADLEASGGMESKDLEALSRRFGRLLGYSPQGINELLSKNSDYRNLASFGVSQQVTHLYYEDLGKAIDFYMNTLGLATIDSVKFQISNDAFVELHPLSEAHPKGQTKSTAVAFLTDQLPEWYQYLQEKSVTIKYTYKPKAGGPHDGFVAVDPGGYLLEFEQFKQHPENELFMATLADAPRVGTSISSLNFYGSITWTYHKDMLKMQQFYEEVLGYQKVADQGWTKIYQTSATGFIGLVDECRGMEDFAEAKAVELEWEISDEETFDDFAQKYWGAYSYSDHTFAGPEKYFYRIKGNK